LLLLVCTAAAAASSFRQEAEAESLVPIRPGVPGKVPFWNAYSRRFIYAPAFDFAPVRGAASYRFTATARDGEHSFETDVPWAPLSPIWAALPLGKVSLRVTALDRKNGNAIGTAGEKVFYRSAVFDGPYRKPVMDYGQSGIRALSALFHKPEIQAWVRDRKPDSGYTLNCYPAKVMGATVLGMTMYSKLASDAAEADAALLAARYAADFLIGLSEPAGRPLEYFPPTYWTGVRPGRIRFSRTA
jgi:maltose/maltodextrin transport system substrate-binding protein